MFGPLFLIILVNVCPKCLKHSNVNTYGNNTSQVVSDISNHVFEEKKHGEVTQKTRCMLIGITQKMLNSREMHVKVDYFVSDTVKCV